MSERCGTCRFFNPSDGNSTLGVCGFKLPGWMDRPDDSEPRVHEQWSCDLWREKEDD